MITHRVVPSSWLVALAAAVLPVAAHAQTVTFNPPATAFTLHPGETRHITASVCLPGQVKKADIYVLIDTTPSMNPVIDVVRANAADIIDSLLATPGVDIKVGIGTYRDFPFDAKPFEHKISPTYDSASLVETIDGLTCGGGGDGSECQLYALQQVATDGSLGFRPDAKRIVVWFGDSPGHDPICPIFVGFGEIEPEITEATATAALQAAGLGGTSVIAISTPTGYDLGLNDDPQLFAGDYAVFCTPGGTAGQADRIAAATSGISTFISDSVQIREVILDTVTSLLIPVELTCELTNGLTPFVKLINPPSYTGVVLPDSPEQFVCKSFDILLEAPPCPTVGQLSAGDFVVRRNGIPLASRFMTVNDPSCKPMQGILVAGLQALPKPKQMKSKDPSDALMLVPMVSWHSPLEFVPSISIPNSPELEGFKVYVQGIARYQRAFGKDRVKVSNGLQITLGSSGGVQAFGPSNGLLMWMDEAHAPVGGTIHLHCAVSH